MIRYETTILADAESGSNPNGMTYEIREEGKFRYLEVGEGEPLVLLHGLFGALSNFSGIIEHFNSPHLRCMFDVANFLGNAMDEIEDPIRALENLQPHVAHVHVKDIGPAVTLKERRTEPYVAGEGFVPLRQVIARLVRGGYAGFYTLEFEAGFKMSETEGVARSLKYFADIRSLHESLHRPALAKSH